MTQAKVSCDGCGKITDTQPDRKDMEGEKWLCFGCALSFAVHEAEAGRPFPYA